MRLDAVRTVVYPKGTGGMDMNLCMKQKVFSWGDRFTVWDENGNDRYSMYEARCSHSAKSCI